MNGTNALPVNIYNIVDEFTNNTINAIIGAVIIDVAEYYIQNLYLALMS